MKSNSIFQSEAVIRRPRLALIMLIAAFGITLFSSFALELPYNYFLGDVMISEAISTVLLFLMELLDIVLYAIVFSLIVFAVFDRQKLSAILGLTAIYLGALLLSYMADLISIVILYHQIEDYIASTLMIFLPELLWNLLLTALVLLLSRSMSKRHIRRLTVQAKASSLLQNESISLSKTEGIYPFRKIFSKQNPVQVCLLTVACVMSVKTILVSVFRIDYGHILWNILGCLGELFVGLIFYALSSFLLNRLYSKI